VETTIGNEIRRHHEAVAIDCVTEDENRPTCAALLSHGIESYISVPIVLENGSFLGTLCALDRKPTEVDTPKIVGMFKLFAELIERHLDARSASIDYQTKLDHELESADIREQFVAELGHDLRNSLASMVGGTRILAKANLDERAKSIVALMLKSVDRMTGLVDNLMDFARGRLGGLELELTDDPLEATILRVVEEMRGLWPGRIIETEFALTTPLKVDHARVAQLISNLLGNALNRGDINGSIRLKASTMPDRCELSIANDGDPVPEENLKRLFQPSHRSSESGSQQRLDLGLYIASEIAKAHGGTLSATSTAEQTRFTVRLPL
ncbi:MAG: GAF domain-containing sensor histidine kinase, partial [Rhizobiaceae bacterium]|nr:GAF domain-containing sensor histidine kinase [Rhizobiaceae bacterium]